MGSNIQQLKREALADRACGFTGDLALDHIRAVNGDISVNTICTALRFQKLSRDDIVALLNAMAGSVTTQWPRTGLGFTTPEAADILEWLDTASDAVADGVGLSDWVAK